MLTRDDGPVPAPHGDGDGLAAGTAIGRYVILSLAGRGAMGEVYAAHDRVLNRKVAIKLLHSRAGQSGRHELDRQLLMREAQSIARLSHPNVVVVHDVGAFGDRVFIAMEFVDGHTLRYWLLAGPRQWREVLRIFAAAGAGLAAAHERALVHRDFKPDNVMIRPDGEVRVMDFGLARPLARDRSPRAGAGTGPTSLPSLFGAATSKDLHATAVIGAPWSEIVLDAGPGAETPDAATTTSDVPSLPEPDMIAGTPAYMSPEQLHGGEPDARGDQFSFCVALYEALYGEGPFRGDTLPERAIEISEGRVVAAPPQTRVPGWIRKVLLRGLMANPDERWASMRELLSRLDENARRLAEIDEWLAERGASGADLA